MAPAPVKERRGFVTEATAGSALRVTDRPSPVAVREAPQTKSLRPGGFRRGTKTANKDARPAGAAKITKMEADPDDRPEAIPRPPNTVGEEVMEPGNGRRKAAAGSDLEAVAAEGG